MGEPIISTILIIIVGIACLVIGILNMKGNISMLHSYHINNISEENKLVFGKITGIGMFIISFSLIIYGCLLIPAELTKENIYMLVANVVLIAGLVLGLVILLYAIKKYNGKIFGKK